VHRVAHDHFFSMVSDMLAVARELERAGFKVPRGFAFAHLNLPLEGRDLAGIDQRSQRIGESAANPAAPPPQACPPSRSAPAPCVSLSRISSAGRRAPRRLRRHATDRAEARSSRSPHHCASGTIGEAPAAAPALAGTSCTTTRCAAPAGTCTSKPTMRVPGLRASSDVGGGSVG
jgi:hypothetical protein